VGKITISLSDDTEQRLRKYVTDRYPIKPFGMLSKVTEQAILELLWRMEEKKVE